jgi:sulfide dehydrogenase cytochrome subunit
MRILNRRLVVALAAGLALLATGQADVPDRGAILSGSCEGCHGMGGRSPGAIPSIAGQPVDYLVTTLEGFRSGERQATVMGRHAKGYTNEEIRLIAEYFSSQEHASGEKQ